MESSDQHKNQKDFPWPKSTGEDKFYALRLVQTSHRLKRFTRWLQLLAVCVVLFLFLPWQQNIRGNGRVIALDPAERPQTVPAIIAGTISRWHVQEGQFVKAGDTLLELHEVKDKYMDPAMLQRLEEQLQAKKSSLGAYSSKIEALTQQIQALEKGKILKLEQTQNKLRQANMKVSIDSASLEAIQVDAQIAKSQWERMKVLYEKQLEPLVKLEERQNKFQSSLAKKNEGENKLALSKNEWLNAQLEVTSILADYQDKISKSYSELSSAQASQFDAQGTVAKLENELSGTRVRFGYYVIRAPQDGYVVKALKAGVGEQLKEGESICTIMPDNPTLAVEIYLRAMDVPLVSKGREVRLQFDGWPAIQVSGWPLVAIGTFGGKVHVIDYVNSAGGLYRVLVKMDKSHDEQWPSQLRVGSGVYAWALLDNVPVIYEIWRQLNGFPPALNQVPPSDAEKEAEVKGKSGDKSDKKGEEE